MREAVVEDTAEREDVDSAGGTAVSLQIDYQGVEIVSGQI
jgi:hypothetical protein